MGRNKKEPTEKKISKTIAVTENNAERAIKQYGSLTKAFDKEVVPKLISPEKITEKE